MGRRRSKKQMRNHAQARSHGGTESDAGGRADDREGRKALKERGKSLRRGKYRGSSEMVGRVACLDGDDAVERLVECGHEVVEALDDGVVGLVRRQRAQGRRDRGQQQTPALQQGPREG